MVAHSTAYAPSDSSAAKLAARRALIVSRFCNRSRSPFYPLGEGVETFTPTARAPGGIAAEPILSPAERRAVRLAVETRRDLELWEIGRASPCYWLALTPSNPQTI